LLDGAGRGFIAGHDPAEVGGGIIDPLLNVGGKPRSGPLVLANGTDRGCGAGGGGKVAAQRGPALRIEKRVAPGDVAGLCLGAVALTRAGTAAAAAGDRGALAPVLRGTVQDDILRRGGR